jgi:tetratricopeptide (TPR) repeat protein
MHELLRQYGEERLAADANAEVEGRDRHSDYYCAAVQKWGSDLRTVRQIAALAEVEADIENVRAAWEWALAQRDVVRLDGALDSLCHFYTLRLRLQEGQAVCRLTADGLADGKPVVPGDAGRVLARVLVWQAVFDGELGHRERAGRSLKRSDELLTEAALAGQDVRREKAFLLSFQGMYAFPDFEKGRRLMTESLAIYRSLDDQWQVARALLNVAHAAYLSGDFDTARQMYEESLTSFQTLGDQFFAVRALITLARSARRLGVLDEAERRSKESLALSQAHGDHVGAAFSLEQLGYLALFQGQFAVGREYLQRSIAAYRERGHGLMVAVVLANLGAAYWLSGAFDQARAPVEAGREIAVQSVSLNNTAIVATYQAKLNMYVGKYDEARTEAQKVLSAADGPRSSLLLGRSHGILGWAALAQESYGRATRSLEESLKSWRIGGDREYEAWALVGLGRAAYGSGDGAMARTHLLKALEIVVEIRAFIMLLHLMPVISLLLVESDEPSLKERAVELYSLATGHPFVAGAQLFEDIAGRHVRAAAAAALAREALAAAEARGRDLDWWDTAEELLAQLRQLG